MCMSWDRTRRLTAVSQSHPQWHHGHNPGLAGNQLTVHCGPGKMPSLHTHQAAVATQGLKSVAGGTGPSTVGSRLCLPCLQGLWRDEDGETGGRLSLSLPPSWALKAPLQGPRASSTCPQPHTQLGSSWNPVPTLGLLGFIPTRHLLWPPAQEQPATPTASGPHV